RRGQSLRHRRRVAHRGGGGPDEIIRARLRDCGRGRAHGCIPVGRSGRPGARGGMAAAERGDDMSGILVSGSVVYDTLVVPASDAPWGTTTFVETIEPHPGGNGANTSLAIAK